MSSNDLEEDETPGCGESRDCEVVRSAVAPTWQTLKLRLHITNMRNTASGHLSFLKYIQVYLHPGFSPPVPVSTPRKVTLALAHKAIMSLLKHALNKSTPTTIRASQT